MNNAMRREAKAKSDAERRLAAARTDAERRHDTEHRLSAGRADAERRLQVGMVDAQRRVLQDGPPLEETASAKSTSLDALPGASYHAATFDAATSADLFSSITKQLPFPVLNRGITRAEGAPRLCAFKLERGASTTGSLDGAALCDDSGDPLPASLAHIVKTLLDRKILRSLPRQCSVNYYDKPDYCMVPHKDGYSSQAVIVSLGSDSALRFWREPMGEEERRARDLLHVSHSGTSVYEECLRRGADCSVWMEPGSALVLEGAALFDFVHGLPAQAHDLYDGSEANAHLVCPAAVHARAAAAASAAGPDQGGLSTTPVLPLTVPRRPRVSVVLWTEFVPPGGAAGDVAGVAEAGPSA